MSSLHHAKQHSKFNARDLESMRASDAAIDEHEPKRDPACVTSHVANCKCVGAARGPIAPQS